MTRQLHPCARTNAAIQYEIQESSETTKAKPTGLDSFNVKTVAKMAKSDDDRRCAQGSQGLISSVLSAAEETLIAAFR